MQQQDIFCTNYEASHDGYENTYDMGIQKPCPSCYQTALEQHGYYRTAPYSSYCSCRMKIPPHMDANTRQRFRPEACPDIKLEHIRLGLTKHWREKEWYSMILIPLMKAFQNPKTPLGVLETLIQYLEHVRRAMGLPEAIWDILEKMRIGRTAESLQLYLKFDKAAAMQTQNLIFDPLLNERETTALVRAHRNRTAAILEASCIAALD